MGGLRKENCSQSMKLVPIGVIHSPYRTKGDAPHQGRLSPTISEIEIFPEYAVGLKDIAELPHLIILYWLDRADRCALTAIPPHSKKEHGVFATRSPEPDWICRDRSSRYRRHKAHRERP